jgi:hypothetical protein
MPKPKNWPKQGKGKNGGNKTNPPGQRQATLAGFFKAVDAGHAATADGIAGMTVNVQQAQGAREVMSLPVTLRAWNDRPCPHRPRA